MPDKDTDPNTLHILRESSEGKKRQALLRVELPPLSPDVARTIHRFDILPSNPISDEKNKKRRADDKDEEDSKSNKDKTRGAADPTKCRHGSGGTCPTCGHSKVSKVTVTGDNYRQMYMEQQKQKKTEEADFAKRTQMLDEQQKRHEQKKANDKQAEIEQMVQAHALQDQIHFWKQQRGQGQYDDSMIDGMVSTLEAQLGVIPTGFWK